MWDVTQYTKLFSHVGESTSSMPICNSNPNSSHFSSIVSYKFHFLLLNPFPCTPQSNRRKTWRSLLCVPRTRSACAFFRFNCVLTKYMDDWFSQHDTLKLKTVLKRMWSRDRDSYGLDDRGVGVRIPVASRTFSTSSRPALGSTQPPI
jgi:hypothetical protein